MTTTVAYRRVYDERSPADGMRVLVDRLWPRGLRKDAGLIDEWAKDLAPSTELRQWYGHEPGRFDEFRQRYLAELADPRCQESVRRLRDATRLGSVTLLTATKDLEHSQAAVLAHWLNTATR